MNKNNNKKERVVSKWDTIKELWEKFATLIGILSSISLIFFYNPSGYSYFHLVKDLDWILDTEHVLIGLIGLILLTPTALDFPSAWRAAGWKGKIIFSIYSVVVALLMYTTGVYTNWHYIVWALEFAVIGFMLFASYTNFRDKKKFSVYGTEEQGTQEVELT